jgi:hypothetical protein
MKTLIFIIAISAFLFSCDRDKVYVGEIFDTHLHFTGDLKKQLSELEKHNVVKGAISTSWENQEKYRTPDKTNFLIGLMFPCPNGIVPYSGQKCFSDGSEYPDIDWVRDQIVSRKVDFLGELLNEYQGISLSDSSMFPYYALADEFKLPIGIHTGLAGPDHLCPEYNPKMGNPSLLKNMLTVYPGLKVWIMHAGAPYLNETIEIMRAYPQVYADISVLANPAIIENKDFYAYMKSLIDAGFEKRLMFGSDNGDLNTMIKSVNELDFLSVEQKEDIFLKNAEIFFGRK